MRSNKLLALALGGLLVAAAACGGSSNGSSNNNGNGKTGGTLVFGTSADPVSMDGAYVSDGESLRVVDQIFETLVTTKAGGTDPEPKLAESYTPSADGKVWTFKLRKNVKFHDGTPFNAAAVCFNFDRWYNFKGIQQSPSVSYYWSTVFGGFKNTTNADVPKTSLYASCQASDDSTAVVNLTSPSASFIPGLAVPAFSIASPDALTKYNADKVSGTGDSPKFDGTFGTQHPVGTGPFKLESFTPGDKLVLARNDDYWGSKAKLDKVIFKPIAKGTDRRQALESGDIQGYDFVDPADVDALKSGFKVMQRPAFNVGYVGFNQKMAPLNNLKIRQAIAHALNRDALVKAKYPPGAQVAKEFMPPQLFGYAADVTDYDYNVDTAKQLIKDSGVAAKDLTLTFWYPTDVSRPYMPDPKANWEAFKSDLEAVGFKIIAKSAPWRPDYNQKVNNGAAQMYLLGWTGDFGDPDNFVGTFFRTSQPAWGFNNPEIFSALEGARTESDLGKRTSDYQAANKLIMDFLPGVPYVHTQPSLAFNKNVNGYVPSPVSLESFATVTVG
ncbi:MAG: peptide/nickel transport system substrate-binding protein [Frankiaceae bacterium]|jgi:peptide/nickel transport system substrate-binding protein|nr:peptide/nickel transport system substrate-binding protein [Frankiaceae bacterium]MDX6226042.1 peptide/nickel transport system substrate-binding protein [Frankiales bacterium]MDX6275702.1 peptide/nickel transport system substrate-binding protein [Frankiales bacterium]